MVKWWVLAGLILLTLTACDDGQSVSIEGKATKKESKELIEQMEWVENANIELLAKQRLKSPNRFLAVLNDGEILIPGLAEDVSEMVVTNGDYEVLAGMSDVVYNSRHAELRVKTRDFATAYNKTLISLIKSNS